MNAALLLLIAPVVVESVLVEQAPLFTSSGFPYNVAEFLHLETRPSKIRSMLLFGQGDPVSKALLEETEVTLRNTGVFREVSVTSDSGGSVKVAVRDFWSTSLYFDAARGGGRQRFGLGIEEHNFLGLAQELVALFQKDFEYSYGAVRFREPDLFGTHAAFSLNARGGKDNRFLLVGSSRPFLSVTDRFNYFVVWVQESRQTFSYDRVVDSAGNTVAAAVDTFNYARTDPGLSLGYNLASGRIVSVNVGAGHLWERWGNEGRYYLGPSFGFTYDDNRFVTTSGVTGFTAEEQWRTGTKSDFRNIYSPGGGLVLKNTTELGLTLGPSWFSWKSVLEHDTRAERTTGQADARGYLSFPHMTLALRVFSRFLEGGYVGEELYLGGIAGLRGYPAWWMDGLRATLAQAELRLWAAELLSVVVPGVVLFADYGTTDYDGGLSDFGVGLRGEITPLYGASMGYLDFAWPSEGGPPVVSFGTGVSF